MKFRSIVLSVVIANLFASVSLAEDTRKMAEEGCKCLKKPYQLLHKMKPDIQDAMQTGNMQTVMALQGEMMTVMKSVEVCFGELEKKYPNVSDETKREAQKIMDAEECPKPNLGIPGINQ